MLRRGLRCNTGQVRAGAVLRQGQPYEIEVGQGALKIQAIYKQALHRVEIPSQSLTDRYEQLLSLSAPPHRAQKFMHTARVGLSPVIISLGRAVTRVALDNDWLRIVKEGAFP